MGSPLPLPKGGRKPQIFGPCLLWPNGWMDEGGTWHGGRPQPFVLDGDPVPFPPKGGRAPLPNFRPISIVTKRLDVSKCHLVWMLASAQGFSAHFCCAQMAGCMKMPLGMEVGLSPGEFVLDISCYNCCTLLYCIFQCLMVMKKQCHNLLV